MCLWNVAFTCIIQIKGVVGITFSKDIYFKIFNNFKIQISKNFRMTAVLVVHGTLSKINIKFKLHSRK